MKQVNLVEFGDLLRHATTIGYDWNGAHDILVRDSVPPEYEITKREWHVSDFDDSNPYGVSDDTQKIMVSFFESESVSTITVIN